MEEIEQVAPSQSPIRLFRSALTSYLSKAGAQSFLITRTRCGCPANRGDMMLCYMIAAIYIKEPVLPPTVRRKPIFSSCTPFTARSRGKKLVTILGQRSSSTYVMDHVVRYTKMQQIPLAVLPLPYASASRDKQVTDRSIGPFVGAEQQQSAKPLPRPRHPWHRLS